MAKYPSLFRRIKLDSKEAGISISDTQELFEQFWKTIKNKCPNNSEKTMAMRKLQESCMWMSRAIAISAFVPSETENDKSVYSKKVEIEDVTIEVPKNPATKPRIILKKAKV